MINKFTQNKISTCINAIDRISENAKILESESIKLLNDTGNFEELSIPLNLRVKCLRKDLSKIEHILTNDVVRYTISEIEKQATGITPNFLQKLISSFRRKVV